MKGSEIDKWLRTADAKLLTDIIADTFGPNPCLLMEFQHENGEDTAAKPCESKRCIHCGPRKQAIFRHQLTQGHGANAWIERTTDKQHLRQAIDRCRKHAQRPNSTATQQCPCQGTMPLYTLIGTDDATWMLISDQPMTPQQQKRDLKTWLDRIVKVWLGARRTARSRRYGLLSLVTRSLRSNRGPSPWKRIQTMVLSTREQRLITELRRREALIRESGVDPDIWDTWLDDDRVESVVTMWKRDMA